MVRGVSRRASLEYLQHLSLQTNGLIKSNYRTSFRHFMSFGEAILDKLLGQAGHIVNVETEGREAVVGLLNAGRGAILFSAHLGNLELGRALADFRDVRLNVLVYTENAQSFNALLAKIKPNSRVSLIPVNQFGGDEAILLANKIAAGELLLITGDRRSVNETKKGVIQVPFLGEEALLPTGPYVLAHVLQCPVFLMFSYKDGQQHRLVFELFADAVELTRKTRDQDLKNYATRYADRLAFYCHKVPLQWFNFFSFWK